MSHNINPIFERVKGETDEQWEAFKIYRDAGLARSITETARAVSISRRTATRYAKKFEWEKRAKSYDAWCDTKDVREHAETIAKDILSDISPLIDDLKTVVKFELAFKKREWAEYWNAIKNGDKPPKPPASSLRTIAETIDRTSSVLMQLDNRNIENKDDDTGDLFKLVKDCKELVNAPAR